MRAPGGVSTNGDKGCDMPPMNPGGELSLMNPKAYMGSGLCKLNPFSRDLPHRIILSASSSGVSA